MTSSTAFPLADPDLADRLAARLALVEERLRDAVTNVGPAGRRRVAAPGQRGRQAAAPAADAARRASWATASRREVVDAAVVVELTHLATLYHDDVMDSAPLRRGAPGRPRGVGQLGRHPHRRPAVRAGVGDGRRARARRRCASRPRTFERLCLGQLHETVGPRPEDDRVAHYLQVLADKTASLIATSARFGAMFAGCRPDVVATVTRVRREDRRRVPAGRRRHRPDLRRRRDRQDARAPTCASACPTMPALLLRARAARRRRHGRGPPRWSRCSTATSPSDDALAAAVAALRVHPVVEETRARAVALAQAAVRELDPLPAGPVKDALVSFADALVDRAS